jgi:hypothetical protein
MRSAPADAVKAGGDPGQNARAIQKLVDDAPLGRDGHRVIRLPAGQVEISDAIRVPADKGVTFDGQGEAQLYRTGYAEAITIGPGGPSWAAGRIEVRNFWAISGRVTTAGTPQVGCLKIERCDFYPEGGYAVDLATGYSGPSVVRDCNFFGPGLRWTYGPGAAEPHATSQLLVEGCQVNGSGHYGPAVWLRGCQMACVRRVVCQAIWGGFADDMTAALCYGTRGVLVDAPGPRGGRLEDIWVEYWGGPQDGLADVRVNNPYKGAAGAYESRDFELANVSAWLPVTVSADPAAANVATVEVRGGSEPVGEGPVVIRRWLTDGLQRRALLTKSPAWDWR